MKIGYDSSMKEKEKTAECNCQDKVFSRGKENCHCHGHKGGETGAIYGLGVVGALFYFLQNTATFGAVLMGIGKAFFWPALIVFKILGILGM